MLDPYRFTRGVPMRQAALNEVMVRRLKEDVRAVQGGGASRPSSTSCRRSPSAPATSPTPRRVNLFIADDTGLGKTIEAGLIDVQARAACGSSGTVPPEMTSRIL